jgi:hypothetical protein
MTMPLRRVMSRDHNSGCASIAARSQTVGRSLPAFEP